MAPTVMAPTVIAPTRECLDVPGRTECSEKVKQMTSSPRGHEIAFTILREFECACTELIGKGVVLSDGKAGTIEHIFLDELHGLRIAIEGHEGRWPVSMVKFAQSS